MHDTFDYHTMTPTQLQQALVRGRQERSREAVRIFKGLGRWLRRLIAAAPIGVGAARAT